MLGDRKTIVFIPDRKLHKVPFAALVDADTQHFLVQDFAIGVTPSATLYTHALEPGRALLDSLSGVALLVADPAFDRDAYPLPRLPGARQELLALSELYPQSDTLLDEAARPDVLREIMRSYEVIHFGTHGILDAESPAWSRLLLAAGDADAGELYAWEISEMELPATRVVTLAACQAADGRIWVGEGSSSSARCILS